MRQRKSRPTNGTAILENHSLPRKLEATVHLAADLLAVPRRLVEVL